LRLPTASSEFPEGSRHSFAAEYSPLVERRSLTPNDHPFVVAPLDPQPFSWSVMYRSFVIVPILFVLYTADLFPLAESLGLSPGFLRLWNLDCG